VILELPDGKILLSQRKYNPAAGMYDLPGGFVDLGERAEDAAIREVKEELNIDIGKDGVQFLASFPNTYEYKGITYFTCDIAFICKYSGPLTFTACDDVKDYRIIHPKDIDFNKISFESIRNVLKLYLEKIKS
jgi:ADP-ribose pyrophosphatase YjhB (NUDIX family)